MNGQEQDHKPTIEEFLDNYGEAVSFTRCGRDELHCVVYIHGVPFNEYAKDAVTLLRKVQGLIDIMRS